MASILEALPYVCSECTCTYYTKYEHIYMLASNSISPDILLMFCDWLVVLFHSFLVMYLYLYVICHAMSLKQVQCTCEY